MKKSEQIEWLRVDLAAAVHEADQADNDLTEVYDRLNRIAELASPDHDQVAVARSELTREQERSRQLKQRLEKLQTRADNQQAELARLNRIIDAGEDRYYEKWKSQLASRVDADER